MIALMEWWRSLCSSAPVPVSQRAAVQHSPSGDPLLPSSPHGKIRQEGVSLLPALPTAPILGPASGGQSGYRGTQ